MKGETQHKQDGSPGDGVRFPRGEELARDLRFAVRSLRANPGFGLVAVLTLALGIGMATAMFSVLNGVLLRDLPVRAQDEVVVLWHSVPARGIDHLPVQYRDLMAFREETRTFEAVAGIAFQGALEQVLVDRGQPVTVGATWVTGDFFPLLGVTPLHGRVLLPTDDVPGAERVMVVSHGFWRRHFGGDPAAVGQGLQWNGERFTVVGVLPRGYEYPRGAEVWTPVLPAFPATLEAQAPPNQVMVFNLVGRLRPGAGPWHGQDEYAAFLRAGDAERPEGWRGMQPVVTPLPELITGDARATLWTAAAAVFLLLLVACVNVANLLLIRGSARINELAIRSALGAGRRRLARQLLTETAVLAVLGGALGLVAAVAAVRVLTAAAPPELPRSEMIGLDGTVLLFALGVTVLTTLLSGFLPAVIGTRRDLAGWLRGGRRTAGAHGGVRSLRHGLIVGQIAIAIPVMVAAGLLVRSLVALQGVELGFNRDRLLVVETSLPAGLLPERPQQVALQEEMLAAVAVLPDVAAAASVTRPPFSGQGGWSATFTGEGQNPEAQATNPLVNLEVAGPGYFRTMEMPLLQGRPFGAEDREDAVPVAVVSEAMARHAWPGQDPIGNRVKLGQFDSPGAWYTVVGVVRETRYRDLTEPQPSLYLPIRQFPGPVPMSLVIRTETEPAALIPDVRAALRGVHPELMLVSAAPLVHHLAEPLARPRFSTLLLGTFAAVTLLLAAVGIYGVMATSVRHRTSELGVRLALGATVEDVRALVLRQGMRLALFGVALGTVAAGFAARALRGMLFGIGPADPVAFTAGAGLILAAAALACYLPALRAGHVDPVKVLQSE